MLFNIASELIDINKNDDIVVSDTQLNEPTNQNSIKVIRLNKPTNDTIL